MISRPILFGSTGLALLLSGVAMAMPQVPIIPLDLKPGQTYVTIDGQYSGVPDDDFKFLKLCPFDDDDVKTESTFKGKGSHHCADEDKTPFLTASEMDAFGGGGIIGVAGSNPWFGGSGQRFELGFSILSGDRNEHREELFENKDDYRELTMFDGKNNNYCDEVPAPNSRNNNNCHRPRHIGIEARADTDYDAYNIVARTLIDFDVNSRFTITPNFGFVYRHTENTTHATASWIDEEYPENNGISTLSMNGGGGFFKRLPELHERIRSTELGVELGTTLSYNLTEALKLFGGVNGEFLYREGRYDNLANGKGYGGGGGGCGGGGMVSINTPCDTSRGQVNFGRHRSDSEDDTAVNVTLSLGAAYRFPGGTTISLIGYAQNESHLVVVDKSHQPAPSTGATLTTSNGGGGSWRQLESERDWTPGVVVALTVPFGGS